MFTPHHKQAGGKGGTHAGLLSGDVLTLHELLYALMLPSGNDAGVAIAEFVGRRMLVAESRASQAELDKAAVRRFVAEMNAVAKRLGCTATEMFDPHGMKSKRANNTSTVSDVVRMMMVALRIPVFAEVCGARRHAASIRNQGKTRSVVWRNTNDLLWGMGDGMVCDGGKTGWIPRVGGQAVWGTLATVVSCEGSDDRFAIVVLGCRSKKRRFIDSMALGRWAHRIVASAPPSGPSPPAGAGGLLGARTEAIPA